MQRAACTMSKKIEKDQVYTFKRHDSKSPKFEIIETGAQIIFFFKARKGQKSHKAKKGQTRPKKDKKEEDKKRVNTKV